MIQMKLIPALGLALAVSLVGNVVLVERWLTATARCDTRIAQAEKAAATEALQDYSDTLTSVLKDVTAERDKLLTDLDGIRTSEARTLAQYRQFVNALPPLSCPPGAARVEAFNREF